MRLFHIRRNQIILRFFFLRKNNITLLEMPSKCIIKCRIEQNVVKYLEKTVCPCTQYILINKAICIMEILHFLVVKSFLIVFRLAQSIFPKKIYSRQSSCLNNISYYYVQLSVPQNLVLCEVEQNKRTKITRVLLKKCNFNNFEKPI